MIAIEPPFVRMLRNRFRPRWRLGAEILVLRHRLNVLQRVRRVVSFSAGESTLISKALLIPQRNRVTWRDNDSAAHFSLETAVAAKQVGVSCLRQRMPRSDSS
jgi:hypothetical protein